MDCDFSGSLLLDRLDFVLPSKVQVRRQLCGNLLALVDIEEGEGVEGEAGEENSFCCFGRGSRRCRVRCLMCFSVSGNGRTLGWVTPPTPR